MSIMPQIKGEIVPIASVGDARVMAPRITTTDGSWLERLWNSFVEWHEKREGRRALRELTADQLKDIGMSRSDAAREVGKSFFWD